MLESLLKDVTDVRWYLPVRTPNDNATEANWTVAMANANQGLLDSSRINFGRVAHAFEVEGGTQADPEAGPVLSFTPDNPAKVDLGAGWTLRLDSGRGEIAAEHQGESHVIWPQAGGAFMAVQSVSLPNGSRVRIDTARSTDHPDAFSPSRIAIAHADGRLTTLRAVDAIA